MTEGALTIVTDIEAAREPALRELLDSIQAEVSAGKLHRAQNPTIPFGDLETVHFARFVILDPPDEPKPPDKPKAPSRLVFATNYDGPRAEHVDELVRVAGQGLQQVFSYCPALKSETIWKALPSFERARTPRDLLDSSVEPNAFYQGHRGRSVSQIRDEDLLRREIEHRLGNGDSKLARDPHAEVRALCEDSHLSWALAPPVPTRLSGWRKGLLVLRAAAVGLPVLLVFGLPWMLALYVLERRDDKRQAELEKSVTNWLEATQGFAFRKQAHLDEEDHNVQNELTVVVPVKKGWLRLLTLRAVLQGIDLTARIKFDKGSLGGIPSIHFARWFLVDDGDGRHRLVFFSNYDGSWESYLGAFVDSASIGLTGIWSNTKGFPKTRWLFDEGSRDEQRFKNWVRFNGRTAEVWYSAYPDLSVSNVNNSSKIRGGLQGFRSSKEKLRWQRRL